MGFSTSGSFVVVLLGCFIALSAFYGSFSNAAERVVAADGDQRDRLDRVQNTRVTVTAVSVVDSTNCDVEVSAVNDGESTLDVDETDLLYDGAYRTDWRRNSTVDGVATDLWRPGETLTITTFDHVSAPDRIRLVTGPGVAATEVTSVTC